MGHPVSFLSHRSPRDYLTYHFSSLHLFLTLHITILFFRTDSMINDADGGSEYSGFILTFPVPYSKKLYSHPSPHTSSISKPEDLAWAPPASPSAGSAGVDITVFVYSRKV
jgi:hypothetical protein